jgi:soluble lytic murein transglycosylase-like protein
MGGTHYFQDMLNQFGQDPLLALAAYNAGPGAVTFYKGVPPYKETQGYVRRVPMYYQYFKFLEQTGK